MTFLLKGSEKQLLYFTYSSDMIRSERQSGGIVENVLEDLRVGLIRNKSMN